MYLYFSGVFVPNSSKPPSKKAVIEWFRAKEIPRKAGFEQDRNAIATWFHGTFLKIHILFIFIYFAFVFNAYRLKFHVTNITFAISPPFLYRQILIISNYCICIII